MSYYNTGQARNTTLTIIRGEESIPPYDLRATFTDPQQTVWPELTDTEFQRLTSEEFEARLAAFCEYVYNLHPGLRSDCPHLTQGCIVWSPTMCPLPTAQQQIEH